MPVIGGAFSDGLDRRRFVTLELFRGLAQRNKGRKTSYFDGPARPCEGRDNPGRPPEIEPRSFSQLRSFSASSILAAVWFRRSIGPSKPATSSLLSGSSKC